MPPLERTTPAGRAARLRSTFFLGALLAALVPAAVDCGGGDDDDDGPGAAFNCADAYGTRCGMGCVSDAACGAGMFCGGGTCTAQCSGGSGCASGQTCSTQGRCVGGGTGGSGTGGSGGGLPPINPGGSGGSAGSGPVAGAGGGGNCPDVSVEFRPIIPAVMLVVDRSASMRCPITSDAELVNECGNPPNADDPDSRWQTFKGPLLSFIQAQDEKVIFGITFYPEGNACGVEAASTVTLKAGAFDEINAAYNAEAPNGQTPTGAAIDSAVAQMDAVADLPDGTPKFIILASDGSPFCGSGTENAQQNAAVANVGEAFDAGIRTFVIAIGELFTANAAKQAQFQAIADAGAGKGKPGGVTGDGPLYPVTNTQALTDALNTIINGVRPCSFDLDVALTNPQADGPKGVVTIDNQPIAFNSPDGWELTDNDTITFVGAACNSIRTGSTDVKASFPCGVETTPVPKPPGPPR